MRFIQKENSPQEFENWKNQENPTHWKNLPSNLPIIREDNIYYYSTYQLKETLIKEQGFLCCYCNIKIQNDSNTAIDHLEPREGDIHTERIFDYKNLLASCIGGRKENTNPKILYCDANKGSSSLPLTPLMQECDNEIYFDVEGKINATSNRGNQSIYLLNLKNSVLNNRRKKAISAYIYKDNEEESIDLLSNDELINNLSIIKKNRSISFHSAILCVLENLITS